MNMSPEDAKKLKSALQDMSNSMFRVESERQLQKDVKNDICKELDIPKKVFSRLAKTFHKNNYVEEVEDNDRFEKIFEGIITGAR
jgi:hypothetical protein